MCIEGSVLFYEGQLAILRRTVPGRPPGPEARMVVVRPAESVAGEIVVTRRAVHEVPLAGSRGTVARRDREISLLGRTRGALREPKIRRCHEERRVARAHRTRSDHAPH